MHRSRYAIPMEHNEFLEEYLSICIAVFGTMRCSGQLDKPDNRPEGTRTAQGLEIKEIFETEFVG